jgi:extracellular elastinolytic metalloproteinase
MYTWTYTTPNKDGALENDIVVHEYGHGVSNRLTGGGTGRCLQTTEAGGMGEGWSDALADITEINSATSSDFTLGSFVTGQAGGIRSYPYSTSKTTNPLTYGSLATRTEGRFKLVLIFKCLAHGLFPSARYWGGLGVNLA